MPERLTPQISNEVAAAAKEFGGLPEAKQLRFENAADIPLAMSLGERLMASIKAQYDKVPKESRAAYEASLSNYQRGLLVCAEIGDGKHLNPNFANAFGEPKTQATPTAPETPAVPRPMPLFLDASGNLQYGVPGTADKALFRVSADMALGYVAQDAKGNAVPGYCFAMENENHDKKMVHVDARTLSQLALMHCLSNEKVIDADAVERQTTPEQGALVRVMRKKAEGAKNVVDPGELKKIEDSTPMIKGVNSDHLKTESVACASKIKNQTQIDAAAAGITDPAAQAAEKNKLTAESDEATKKKDAIDSLVAIYKENPKTGELASMFEALWKYHDSGIDGEIAAQEKEVAALAAKLATPGITDDAKEQYTSEKNDLEAQVKLIKKEKATGFKDASAFLARMMQEGNLSPATVKAVRDMLEAQPSDTKAFMEVMRRAGDEAAEVELDRVLTVNKLEPEVVQETKKGLSNLGKLLLAGGGILSMLLMTSILEAASGGNSGRSMDDIMRMVTMLMGGQGAHDPAFENLSYEERHDLIKRLQEKRRGGRASTAPEPKKP